MVEYCERCGKPYRPSFCEVISGALKQLSEIWCSAPPTTARQEHFYCQCDHEVYQRPSFEEEEGPCEMCEHRRPVFLGPPTEFQKRVLYGPDLGEVAYSSRSETQPTVYRQRIKVDPAMRERLTQYWQGGGDWQGDTLYNNGNRKGWLPPAPPAAEAAYEAAAPPIYAAPPAAPPPAAHPSYAGAAPPAYCSGAGCIGDCCRVSRDLTGTLDQAAYVTPAGLPEGGGGAGAGAAPGHKVTRREEWDTKISSLLTREPLHVHTVILPPGVQPGDPRLKNARVVAQRTYVTDKLNFPQEGFYGSIEPELGIQL